MLIEIHSIQNHSPANLNRDDLGAPKTCYFGGVVRSRISSQCIKRSIRTSDAFKKLLGGVRTRQLARLIAKKANADAYTQKRAEKILSECGFKPKKARKSATEDQDSETDDRTSMLVYTSWQAIEEMAQLLEDFDEKSDEELAMEFAEAISRCVAVPDMALSGRMLQPEESATKVWKTLDRTVEGALQVAHAISTHEARPEVDYYVAADDISGDVAGAGYVDEAMFASACFYKYFSIDWGTLVENLKGYGKKHKELAAHTVGAFIQGAALVNPTGKQNSFAAHNPPDGMLVEIRETPVSYANAFARPVTQGERDIISQSIAQLAQYIRDLDTGYGKPEKRSWFSPNLRHTLSVFENNKEIHLADNNIKSLDEFISDVIAAIGHDWNKVQKVAANLEATR